MRADPAGWPYQDPGGDDPDWTGGGDHPDWTAGDDGWPAGGASPGWPYGGDHPSWPASSDHPDWPRGGGSAVPGREPPAVRHDGHRRAASPPAPAAPVRVPAGDEPDEARHWSGQQGAAAAYYDVAAGDGWVQVLLPSDSQHWPAAADGSTGQLPQITANGPAGLLDPVRQDIGGFQGEDSVRLTERILSDADSQAAGIRREALDHANAIRHAAEREAEEIRREAAYQAVAAREAGRKAEEIRRQAAYQAEAMREAAEREADELRAGAIRLSAELGQVAAYVTRTLTMPAIPVPEPQAQPRQHVAEDFALPATPAAEPAARATARPGSQARTGQYYTEDLDGQARPGGGPETWEPEEAWEPESPPPAEPDDVWLAVSPGEIWPTRPAGRATTRPAARPHRRPARPATRPARRTDKPARSRQYRSMRAFAGTITALVVLALGTGAYQFATHGFTFFVFRSAGTGATDNNAIFPGIIPAPKPSPAHQQPTTGPGHHRVRRTHHHVNSTAGR
jgi:hypothetical protein